MAWPTSIATDSELFVAVNNLSTLLTDNPLTIGATTVNVTDTTGFPTVGYISIDAEIIHYTGITATSFTGCTRGALGTTAASHILNSQVDHNVVSAHHNVLKDEIIAVETSLDFTANRAIVSNASGRLTVSVVTDTEIGYLSGVTSAIQTQLDTKATDTLVVHLAGTETVTGQKTFNDLRGTLGANINANGFKLTNLAAGTTNGDSVRFEDLNNGLGAGKILQVVMGTQTGSSSTTSTSFVDTGTTVSITPQRTDSKILLIASGSLGQSDILNGVAYATLARNSTNLGDATTGMCTVDSNIGANQLRVPAAMTYLDSPATTSAITYKVQIRTNNASHTTTWGLGQQQIIAIEVAV